MAAELVDLFNSEIDLKVRIAVAARDQDPSVHFGPHAQYETFDVAFVRASHDSEEAFFTPIGAPTVCHFLKFLYIHKLLKKLKFRRYMDVLFPLIHEPQ